ncbi:hypothetical protein KC19_12G105000 [Ceratodon purpureus]|uniref:Uncharacterized protein n=1 Tax=Ceratodon purpureus TaxID=3225 RepID=A0A8T0G8E8_CERPU|nr:hypothetical protein KC19_12G105000 [Ceratodon purpureus]
MRSHAMTGLKLAVLFVLLGMVAADLTVDETIINGCTSDVTVLCTTVNNPFAPQTLTPDQSTKFTITSSLGDPSLTCNFTSAGVPQLKTPKMSEIWNLLYSGFTDFPMMSCTAGCTWKVQDDGIYWAQPGGSFKLFNLWTAPGTAN